MKENRVNPVAASVPSFSFRDGMLSITCDGFTITNTIRQWHTIAVRDSFAGTVPYLPTIAQACAAGVIVQGRDLGDETEYSEPSSADR